MAERVPNPTRRAARSKAHLDHPSGLVTPEMLAKAMPSILGRRGKGIAVNPIGIATLAATVDHARRCYAALPAADRRHAEIVRAAGALRAALAAAEVAGDRVPAAEAARGGLAALLAPARVKWAGQDHAALALSREFQATVWFLVPGAAATLGGRDKRSDDVDKLGSGGATAKFVAWALTRITGTVTSPDSAERMLKRARARYKAGGGQTKTSLQDRGLGG